MSQTLKLTPEQIQVIKMLEIPNVELRQRIDEELQSNPMLEVDEDVHEEPKQDDGEMEDWLQGRDDDSDNAAEEDDFRDDYTEDLDVASAYEMPDSRSNDYDDVDDFEYDYRYRADNTSPDDEPTETVIVSGKTLNDYLVEQVGMLPLSELEQNVAEYIIGNIDERGYLTRSPEQMVDDLAFHLNINIADADMERLVETVRHLDPPGVGARDLQDCLLLQLRAMKQTPIVMRAQTFIEKNFTEVGKRHYERIAKRHNLSLEEVKDAIAVIAGLNPTPSSAFSGDIYETSRAHIIPDFRVESLDGEIVVSLYEQDLPSLRVSQEYIEMLNTLQTQHQKKTEADKEGIRYIKKNIDSANWFIDAIRQRNETLLTTMRAIAAFQREYFLEGDDCFLKPMILEDIARVTGLDSSTISRVSNSKYVLTDFGIIPLKHFFSEALTTDQGNEVSTREVKKFLRDVIDKEDKRNPLNDDRLVELLAESENGYRVARRTIAKYREQLGIPVARLRRQI